MSFQPAICSPSLGHQTVHSISSRLKAAASCGFKLIELVEDDLTFYALDHLGGASPDTMEQAARIVKEICDNLDIKPFVFQPFWFYEGLIDRKEHDAKIIKLRLWMRLCKILGIRLIQIPANWMTEGITGDKETIVADLTEMANIGLEQDPVVSIAYEGVAWGTYIDTWQGTWEIVQQVNKPNFGLCIDSYHIVARDWGDPTAVGCKRPDGDESLKRSMEELVEIVDVEKVFYVQLGDAELLDKPLIEGHELYNDQQLPRMTWSRNARLFAWENEENGCLPLEPLMDALFNKMNYKGYVSMETFSRHLFDESPSVPKTFGSRAMKSWNATMSKIRG